MNGQDVGALGNYSYMFVDRDPGSYKVNVELPLTLGSSWIDVTVRPGSVAYVSMGPRMRAAAAAAVGGLAGAVIEAAVADDGKSGPFSIKLLDQAAGAAMLQEIRQRPKSICPDPLAGGC